MFPYLISLMMVSTFRFCPNIYRKELLLIISASNTQTPVQQSTVQQHHKLRHSKYQTVESTPLKLNITFMKED